MDDLRVLTEADIEALDPDSEAANGWFVTGEWMTCAATGKRIEQGQKAYLWNGWVLRSPQEVEAFEARLEEDGPTYIYIGTSTTQEALNNPSNWRRVRECF